MSSAVCGVSPPGASQAMSSWKVRACSWKSHLLEHKSKKRKRTYAKKQPVAKADRKEVRRALGI